MPHINSLLVLLQIIHRSESHDTLKISGVHCKIITIVIDHYTEMKSGLRQCQSFGPWWATGDAFPPRGHVGSRVEEKVLPLCNVEQHVGVRDVEQVRQSELIPRDVLQFRKRRTSEIEGKYERMNVDTKVAKLFVRAEEATMYKLVDIV